MKVTFRSRAEVAFRSLDALDRAKVAAVLQNAETGGSQALTRGNQLRKLHQPSNNNLYAIRVTPRLRLVVSLQNDVLTVEDIAPPDRVDRLLRDRR